MNAMQVGSEVVGSRPIFDFFLTLVERTDIAGAAEDARVDAFLVSIEIVCRAESSACPSTVGYLTYIRLCVSLIVLARL